jgi:hypothetical protein
MEHRRRTLSSAFDDEIVDIEKQIPRRRGTSASIDDTIDDYTEYVYNGTFSLTRLFCTPILNLICPCFRKERAPITVNNNSD